MTYKDMTQKINAFIFCTHNKYYLSEPFHNCFYFHEISVLEELSPVH